MSLTLPNPSNIKVQYNTRAEFVVSTIPDTVNFVMADGLIYERDSAGTALTAFDGSKWSPTLGHITPAHFGAVADGATDSADEIQAMFDWGAVKSAEIAWDSTGKSPDYTKLVFDFSQGTYAVSKQIELNADNSHCVILNPSIKAIAGTWSTDGEEIIWQDGSIVSASNPAPETAISGTVYFRHELDDFIFKCKANCTYVTFENPDLNCNGLCGGLFLRSRCTVKRPNIRRIGWVPRTIPGGGDMEDAYTEEGRGAIGIYAQSGDAHIRDGWVGQFDQTDPEYFDALQWNAIGIYAADSDLTVIGTKFRWAWSNIVLTGTNHRFVQIHSFNGMRSYSFSERNAADQTMLDAYFGFSTATYNCPIRYYHAGVAVMAHKFEWDGSTWSRSNGKNWDNTFDDCYFDNCHFDLHSDGVRFNNPKLGAKDTSSLSYPGATYVNGASVSPTGSIDYWWKAWANSDANQVQRLSITGLEPFVEGTVKKIVEFADGDTTWLNKGVAFGSLDNNKMEEVSADNWEMKNQYTHLNPGKGTPCVTYFTFGSDGSKIQFADGTTTSSSGAITTDVLFGAEGDDAVVSNNAGNIELTLTAGSGNIILTGDGSAARYIRLVGLPTSNPGGSDRLWNDGGTLKIT
jgi:hypothetical protein